MTIRQAQPTPRQAHYRLDISGVTEDIREIYSLLSWMARGPNNAHLDDVLAKLVQRTDYMRNKLITFENDLRAAGVIIPWEPEPYPEGWGPGGPL